MNFPGIKAEEQKLTFLEWVLESLETYDICKILVDGDPYMSPDLPDTLNKWGRYKAIAQ